MAYRISLEFLPKGHMNEELGKERILEVLDRISKFLSQDEKI